MQALATTSAFAVISLHRYKGNNGKYGYKKEAQGSWVISPKFDECPSSLSSPDQYAIGKINGKYYTFDETGELLYHINSSFIGGYLRFRKLDAKQNEVRFVATYNKLQGVVNHRGEYILPPIFNDVHIAYDKHGDKLYKIYAIKKGVLMIFSLEGTLLKTIADSNDPLQEIYLHRTTYSKGVYKKGEKRLTLAEEYAGLLAAKSNGKWGIIDSSGNKLTKFEYTAKPSLFSDGAICTKSGNVYIWQFDRNGKFAQINGVPYSFAKRYDKFIVVGRNGRYGATTLDNQVLIPIKSKSCEAVTKKCKRLAQKGKKKAMIDKAYNDLYELKKIAGNKIIEAGLTRTYNYRETNRIAKACTDLIAKSKTNDEKMWYYLFGSMYGVREMKLALAKAYFDKSFTPKPNYKVAVPLLKYGVEAKDEACKKYLGECYLFGNGIEQDIYKAFEIFFEGYSYNTKSSYYAQRLGDCYDRWGSLGDVQVALKLYQSVGAKVRSERAKKKIERLEALQFKLDTNYQFDEKFETGDKQQREWQNRGEEYYNKGDYKSAYYYYKKGADTGYAPCIYNISVLYGRKYEGFTDLASKCYWIERALPYLKNTTFAYYVLGSDYSTLNQYDKAYKYVKSLADKGENVAEAILGDMYEKGAYVKKDYTKALEYYTKAAQHGYEYAMFQIGHLLFGNKKEHLAATRYYLAAHLLGYNSEMAISNIGRLLSKSEKAYAAPWLEITAQNGNKEDLELLAKIYYKHDNYAKALECFQKLEALSIVSARYYNTMARCCHSLDKIDMAHAYYNKAIALDKNNGFAYIGKAVLYTIDVIANKDEQSRSKALQTLRYYYDKAVATGDDLGILGTYVKAFIESREKIEQENKTKK